MTEIERWIFDQAQNMPNNQKAREAILREAYGKGQQSVRAPVIRMTADD